MLTHDRLREVLRYDPETGLWTWLVKLRRNMQAGDRAGCIGARGYRTIRLDGKQYQSGRLVWFYQTGEWPPVEVDHEDRDRSNDRWLNLRLATSSQNKGNRGVSANNVLGIKGVTACATSTQNKFRARITLNGKVKHLGSFPTAEDASAAYADAAKSKFGDYAWAI